MGGSQSRRDESFRANEWEQAYDIQIPPQSQGQYIVVRNRLTGQLLDKYSLQFPNENEYNKYLQSISHRRNQSNIIRVAHFQPAVIKQFCGSSFILNVYLEHCKSRLSEYQDIPFPDYLYCAMGLLDGYKKLYNKIGRFYVSERQAMIDRNGEIRVWLNQDFSSNQAEDLRIPHYNTNDPNQQQYAMVEDIMEIIFQNSDLSQGPAIKLIDFYERQKNSLGHKVGFEEAKGIIHQYSKINKIQIPDIFKSVYQIYQDQGDQRNYQNTMSFRNQLLNQDQFQQQNEIPIHSSLPSTNNFVSRPNPMFHSDITQNNFSPRIASTNFISNQSYRPSPLSTPNYGLSSQPSFNTTQLPAKTSFLNLNHPRPIIMANQRQPIQFQQQAITILPQQGFPITIRPTPQPPILNNVQINRNPYPTPTQNFQNFPIPIQNNQIKPIIRINRPTQPIPIKNYQPIKQPQPLFKSFTNNSPKSGTPLHVQNNLNININHANEQNELQIQKKLLKQQNNFNEDVNEAYIISQLNQLRKIEQQQEYHQRNGISNSSRKMKSNASEIQRRKSNQPISEIDEHREVDSPHRYQSKNSQQGKNESRFNHQRITQNNNFNFQAGYITQKIEGYDFTSQYIPSQSQKNVNTIRQFDTPNFLQSKTPLKPLPNQPKSFLTFNPYLNSQAKNFNNIEINQTYSSRKNETMKSSTNYKKQYYYTLLDQVQLDPQIAADLATYV